MCHVDVTNYLTIKLIDTRNGYSEYFFIDDKLGYIWTKGVYSCDCNRALILYRDRDIDLPEEEIERLSEIDCNEGENVIKLEVTQGKWNYET